MKTLIAHLAAVVLILCVPVAICYGYVVESFFAERAVDELYEFRASQVSIRHPEEGIARSIDVQQPRKISRLDIKARMAAPEEELVAERNIFAEAISDVELEMRKEDREELSIMRIEDGEVSYVAHSMVDDKKGIWIVRVIRVNKNKSIDYVADVDADGMLPPKIIELMKMKDNGITLIWEAYSFKGKAEVRSALLAVAKPSALEKELPEKVSIAIRAALEKGREIWKEAVKEAKESMQLYSLGLFKYPISMAVPYAELIITERMPYMEALASRLGFPTGYSTLSPPSPFAAGLVCRPAQLARPSILQAPSLIGYGAPLSYEPGLQRGGLAGMLYPVKAGPGPGFADMRYVYPYSQALPTGYYLGGRPTEYLPRTGAYASMGYAPQGFGGVGYQHVSPMQYYGHEYGEMGGQFNNPGRDGRAGFTSPLVSTWTDWSQMSSLSGYRPVGYTNYFNRGWGYLPTNFGEYSTGNFYNNMYNYNYFNYNFDYNFNFEGSYRYPATPGAPFVQPQRGAMRPDRLNRLNRAGSYSYNQGGQYQEARSRYEYPDISASQYRQGFGGLYGVSTWGQYQPQQLGREYQLFEPLPSTYQMGAYYAQPTRKPYGYGRYPFAGKGQYYAGRPAVSYPYVEPEYMEEEYFEGYEYPRAAGYYERVSRPYARHAHARRPYYGGRYYPYEGPQYYGEEPYVEYPYHEAGYYPYAGRPYTGRPWVSHPYRFGAQGYPGAAGPYYEGPYEGYGYYGQAQYPSYRRGYYPSSYRPYAYGYGAQPGYYVPSEGFYGPSRPYYGPSRPYYGPSHPYYGLPRAYYGRGPSYYEGPSAYYPYGKAPAVARERGYLAPGVYVARPKEKAPIRGVPTVGRPAEVPVCQPYPARRELKEIRPSEYAMPRVGGYEPRKQFVGEERVAIEKPPTISTAPTTKRILMVEEKVTVIRERVAPGYKVTEITERVDQVPVVAEVGLAPAAGVEVVGPKDLYEKKAPPKDEGIKKMLARPYEGDITLGMMISQRPAYGISDVTWGPGGPILPKPGEKEEKSFEEKRKENMKELPIPPRETVPRNAVAAMVSLFVVLWVLQKIGF